MNPPLESWQAHQERTKRPGFHRRQGAPEVTVPWSDEALSWLSAHASRFYVSRITPAHDPTMPRPIHLYTDDYDLADRFEREFGGGE